MPPRAITNNDNKVPGIPPTDKEMETLMANLNKCTVKPVPLCLMLPYADQFILKSRNIPTVPDLFSSDNLELSYPELLKKGN